MTDKMTPCSSKISASCEELVGVNAAASPLLSAVRHEADGCKTTKRCSKMPFWRTALCV